MHICKNLKGGQLSQSIAYSYNKKITIKETIKWSAKLQKKYAEII